MAVYIFVLMMHGHTNIKFPNEILCSFLMYHMYYIWYYVVLAMVTCRLDEVLIKPVTYQGFESSFLSYWDHIILIVTVKFLLHHATNLNLCQAKPSTAMSSKTARTRKWWQRRSNISIASPHILRAVCLIRSWGQSRIFGICITIRLINTEMNKKSYSGAAKIQIL